MIRCWESFTLLLFHAQVLIRHFSFYFHFANNARRMPNLTDQNCVKMIYEKLSHLYNRIIKTHENINNMLDSIRIWAKVPFCKRQEGTATTLLDIDDRSLKCSTQCGEVNNSKKLIEYTMEENYRLLFGLPSLERKREFGKDRFRNTIIRKFGRHRAKEKIERLPSMVRKFQNLLNSTSSVFHTISIFSYSFSVDFHFLIFFFFFLSFFFSSSFFFSFASCQFQGWIITNRFVCCGWICTSWENCKKCWKFKAFSRVWRVYRQVDISSVTVWHWVKVNITRLFCWFVFFSHSHPD